MANKDFLPKNPATDCKLYGVQPPKGAGNASGSVREISPMSLSTEPVDLCAYGWKRHLTDEGDLSIIKVPENSENYDDLGFVNRIGDFYVGHHYRMTQKDGYSFPEIKKIVFQVSNQHRFDRLSKSGADVLMKVTCIMKDPMVGHVIVFEVVEE